MLLLKWPSSCPKAGITLSGKPNLPIHYLVTIPYTLMARFLAPIQLFQRQEKQNKKLIKNTSFGWDSTALCCWLFKYQSTIINGGKNAAEGWKLETTIANKLKSWVPWRDHQWGTTGWWVNYRRFCYDQHPIMNAR